MAIEMHDVEFDIHMKQLAPFSPSDDLVNECLAQLREDKKVEETGGSWRFTEFLPPKNARQNEMEAFRPLGAICESMRKVQLDGFTRYRHMGNTETLSAIQGSTHKVDAVLRLDKTRVPYDPDNLYTTDIGCNLEYKLGDGTADVRDNRLKAVSGAVHILNNDPARDFTYSITIENTALSIWYWSRSYSTRTKPFDCTKNVKSTIKALASFLFATEEQLGYNPSIRYCSQKEGGKTTHHLVYKVENRFFKTTKTVSDYPNLGVTGRGTRVFEVVEVPSFDDLHPVEGALPKVLKHVWLEQQAKTEKEILAMVFERLEALQENEAELKKRVLLMADARTEADEFSRIEREVRDGEHRNYFLTIDCDERGLPSKSLPHGASANPTLFSKDPRPMKPAKTHRSGGVPSLPCWNPRHHRCRHRIKGCSHRRRRGLLCIRRYVRPSTRSTISTRSSGRLRTASEATTIFLNLVGWVHRDISSGNLLWDPQVGHGILSDLEYGKDMKDIQGSGDPKTGTPPFMAVEIATGRLLRAGTRTDDPFEAPPVSSSEPQPQLHGNGVQHIFPHDSESFLWLVLWMLSERLLIDEAEQSLLIALNGIRSMYYGKDSTTNRVFLAGFVNANQFVSPFHNTSMFKIFWAIGKAFALLKRVYEDAARNVDDDYTASFFLGACEREGEGVNATTVAVVVEAWPAASRIIASSAGAEKKECNRCSGGAGLEYAKRL
ncbi:hypothetical protein C8Q80DRAFT_375939 [Daedaleopsis nitida]|nr:hypothetical protein C8Q80DRAFT_375939 [Daedaleopsis nitida]